MFNISERRSQVPERHSGAEKRPRTDYYDMELAPSPPRLKEETKSAEKLAVVCRNDWQSESNTEQACSPSPGIKSDFSTKFAALKQTIEGSLELYDNRGLQDAYYQCCEFMSTLRRKLKRRDRVGLDFYHQFVTPF